MDEPPPTGQHQAPPDSRSRLERIEEWARDLPRRPGRRWRAFCKSVRDDPTGFRATVWKWVAIVLFAVSALMTWASIDSSNAYDMAHHLAEHGEYGYAQDVRMSLHSGGKGGPYVDDVEVLYEGHWYRLRHTAPEPWDAEGDAPWFGSRSVEPSSDSRYPIGVNFEYDPSDPSKAMAENDIQEALEYGPWDLWSYSSVIVLWVVTLAAGGRWFVWQRRAQDRPMIGRHAARDE